MASTFDYINALNAQQMSHPLGPLTDISQNDAALAAYELKRQQDLQDMAQRNFFTQQLVAQQHQFQQTQAQKQQRSQMGLLEKGAQLRSQEAEKEFKLRTDEEHARQRRARLQTLYQYGGDAPSDASDFQIEQAIQDRAGQAFGNVLQTMGVAEKQIMAQSEEDPKVTHIKLEKMIAEDPKFRPILNDYPELKKQFGTGTVEPGNVQDVLLEKTYSPFGPGADDRVNTFLRALNNAKATLAAQEAANPDAKKRPGYLQAVNTYQLLLKEAGKHIDALRTPERVQEALKGLLPLQPARAPVPLTKFQTVAQSVAANAGRTTTQPAIGIGTIGTYPLPPSQGTGPLTALPAAAPVAYEDKVANVLKVALNDFSDLVPTEAKPYIAGRRQAMSPETADTLLNSYIVNLRNEIVRIQAQPGERGKAGRIAPLQRELSRASNLLIP
jgi:hypothetical protein